MISSPDDLSQAIANALTRDTEIRAEPALRLVWLRSELETILKDYQLILNLQSLGFNIPANALIDDIRIEVNHPR